MKVVLLPVKHPELGKQRLRGILSPWERSELVWNMFEDVAEALQSARVPGAVVVVTASERVAEYARSQQWRVLRETEQVSESCSVDFASRLLQGEGVAEVLRIPADIPWVQDRDIDALLTLEISQNTAVLVPSRDGDGTNALLRRPPDAFSCRFGPGSFRQHQQEAWHRGIAVQVIENLRIAFDLDEPPDLVEFARLDQGQTRTGRFLQQLEWEKRESS